MKILYTKDKKFYAIMAIEDFNRFPNKEDYIIVDTPLDYDGFIGDLDIDIDAKTAIMNITRKDNRNKDSGRAKAYSEEADPLFMEAVREKLEGSDVKWNIYIAKVNSIKARFPKGL